MPREKLDLRKGISVVYLETMAAAPVVSIINVPFPDEPGKVNQSSLSFKTAPLK
jgi:hypothetical protein